MLILSTATGTGKTAAFRRSAANVNLNNYSTLSNNNDFYAGTPGASNVIFFDGTNSDQTLEDFKLRVTPRETSSITENVPFVNTTTTPYDLPMFKHWFQLKLIIAEHQSQLRLQ